MDDREMQEVARRAVTWLTRVEPEITLDWNTFEYDEEITAFLWQNYLEAVAQDVERYAEKRVAEVASRIKAAFHLEESGVTKEASVPVGEDQ